MVNNPSEKIVGPLESSPTKGLSPDDQGQAKPGKEFSSYMQGGEGVSKSAAPSPMNLAMQGNTLPSTAPTLETLNAQASSTSSLLGDLQSQFTNKKKDLKLSESKKYLLRNKLMSSNGALRDAAIKAGAGGIEPLKQLSRENPVAKFLGILTNSQKQLQGVQERLNNLNTDGQSMNPGEMLVIQTKLAKAQQELEYSSVLLSSVTSDIKTLMNIQL